METNPSHITGKDLIYSDNLNVIANKQKNIYDMAGNVWEWTMEAYDTGCRVYRGGSYGLAGSNSPASYRIFNGPDILVDGIGFRLALYL